MPAEIESTWGVDSFLITYNWVVHITSKSKSDLFLLGKRVLGVLLFVI